MTSYSGMPLTSLLVDDLEGLEVGRILREEGGEDFDVSPPDSFFSFFFMGLGSDALGEMLGRTLCIITS